MKTRCGRNSRFLFAETLFAGCPISVAACDDEADTATADEPNAESTSSGPVEADRRGAVQRGDRSASPASEPPRYIQVSAGTDQTCAVTDTGNIVCWGTDEDGQSSPP